MRRVDPDRLVFLDEAGANLAMGRSHAWVLRGEEHVEPRPMNWGDNLTLVGAIHRRGWVTLGTAWGAMTAKQFLRWVRTALVPRLWPGAIVVLDNLAAHKQAAVQAAIRRAGARVKYLPPYSHDFNPVESAWALVKKHIKTCAPRTGAALRRVARAGRYAVRPHHCPRWFAHTGYGGSSTFRG
jgi:putative transposase